jgi:hypothetical protein
MSLSACATSETSSTSQASPTATKEAGIFTKDIVTCITNNSGSPIDVSWTRGLSTHDSSGTLAVGGRACGEGPAPKVKITYADGFGTYLNADNPVVGTPYVIFTSTDEQETLNCDAGGSCSTEIKGKELSGYSYSQGEAKTNNVSNHTIVVTRLSDSDWINFEISVK